MDRRIGTAILLSLLVTLAGCVSLGSSGDAAAPTTDDGAGQDRDGDVALVENRTAALRAAGSYTSVWKMEFARDGDVVGATTYTHAVDYESERSRFSMVMVNGDEVNNDYEVVQSDGVSYARYGAGEDATYQVSEAAFDPENTLFPVQSYVADSGDLADFAAAGTETHDGVTVTRYERTDRPTWVTAQGSDGNVTWTSFTYVVLVDADGLVRSESWSGEGVADDGTTQTVAFSYSVTDVGSTAVEEPDWTATARDQSAQ